MSGLQQKRNATGTAVAIALAGLGLWGAVSAAHGDTLTFTMGDGKTGSLNAKDSWIIHGGEEYDPEDMNFGGDIKLRVHNYPSSLGDRRTLVAWPNLIGTAADQIPAGATITSATLRLTPMSINVGSPNIQAGMLQKDWLEGPDSWHIVYNAPGYDGVTWNMAVPHYDHVNEVPWEVPGASGAHDLSVANPPIYGVNGLTGQPVFNNLGEPEDWNVTPYVQAWANGSGNYGMLLWIDAAANDAGNSEFHSREDETAAANKPTLTINYTPASPGNPADLNHDGVVNQLDLNIVIGAWQKTGQTHDQGDINGDGVVNQLDLNTVIGNWQKTGEPAGISALSVVPEPALAGLLGLGVIGLVRRRR